VIADILIGFVYGIPVGGCIYALAARLLRGSDGERIERLIEERDAARREVSRRHAYLNLSEEEFAKWLEWDCFDKSETGRKA